METTNPSEDGLQLLLGFWGFGNDICRALGLGFRSLGTRILRLSYKSPKLSLVSGPGRAGDPKT